MGLGFACRFSGCSYCFLFFFLAGGGCGALISVAIFVYFQIFVLSLVVVILVAIIFNGGCEQNNLLRCCLVLIMARLLVLVALVRKYINLIFSRFSLVVKQLTSMLFVIVMKKLKICFARVDLYRLILDIIS